MWLFLQVRGSGDIYVCMCVYGWGEWNFLNVNRNISMFLYLVFSIYLCFIFQESKIDEHHFVAVALRKPNGSRHQDVRF